MVLGRAASAAFRGIARHDGIALHVGASAQGKLSKKLRLHERFAEMREIACGEQFVRSVEKPLDFATDLGHELDSVGQELTPLTSALDLAWMVEVVGFAGVARVAVVPAGFQAITVSREMRRPQITRGVE